MPGAWQGQHWLCPPGIPTGTVRGMLRSGAAHPGGLGEVSLLGGTCVMAAGTLHQM